MMRVANGTPQRRQRGVAMVEFAIALPLLLLLLLATAELGRMLSQYDTLTKAVRDGVRYAASTAALGSTGIVYITPATQIAVANLVATGTVDGSGAPLLPGLTAADVTVTDAGNEYVAVSASYAYQPMLGATLPTFGLGNPIPLTITLNAGSVMRAL
jgi:Flp pilus assembly protein TadG